MAVGDFIGFMSPSHLSASYDVNDSTRTGSDDHTPLMVGQAPPIPGVPVNGGSATLATSGKMPSDARSVSGTRSTLLTNQPSAVATSNRAADCTSPTKSGFGGVKRSGSRKKNDVNRALKAIIIPEKTGCQSKVFLPPGKIKIKIPVPSAAASTASSSTGASSTHETLYVEMDDYDALTILPRSSSGKEGGFSP